MARIRFRALALLLSLAALAPPGRANAQVTPADSLRQQYRLQVPTPEQSRGAVVRPNAKFSPGAAAYSMGQTLGFFVGAAYTRTTRYNKGDHDGIGVAGVGFGDPSSYFGVQADLMFYSTFRSKLLRRMGLDLAVNRFLPGDLFLTVGWENFMVRGVPDSAQSRYVSLSRWFPLRRPEEWFSMLGFSVGVGDGRFVREEDWLVRNNRPNVFGSAMLQIAWPLGLIADWQGDDLALALALTPFRSLPFVITPGVADVTGRISSGPRFVATAGYLIQVPLCTGACPPG